MRNPKFLIGAAVSIVAVSVASIAYANTVTQTTDGTVTPRKLPKRTFKPVKLHVRTEATDGNNIPPPANHAVINLDNDLKINANAVPKCDVSQVSGKSTAAARAACKSSLVGVGTAQLLLGAPGSPITGPGTVPVKVSGFNGKPNNAGQPTLILHSDPGFTPVDLIGTLKRSTAGPKFKMALDVIVPPTGGSLKFFDITIGKVNNQLAASPTVVPGPYVKARCKQPDHKFNFFGKFTFDDTGGTYPTTAEGRSASRCKVKHRRR